MTLLKLITQALLFSLSFVLSVFTLVAAPVTIAAPLVITTAALAVILSTII